VISYILYLYVVCPDMIRLLSGFYYAEWTLDILHNRRHTD